MIFHLFQGAENLLLPTLILFLFSLYDESPCAARKYDEALQLPVRKLWFCELAGADDVDDEEV